VIAHIARPYATALYDLAHEQGQLGPVEADLIAIGALVEENSDFSRFLHSPVISGDEKATAMEAILARANASPIVANFVKLVARNGRLFALPTIIASFRRLAADARGEVSAVTLQEHVDPSLIGGLIVKVGSQMIDSSLKTKLTAMKIAMKEVG